MRNTIRNHHLRILAVVTFFGGLLRFYHLGLPSLWIDEAYSFVYARAILEHGIPLLPNGMVEWSYAPAHYLMALGTMIFGDVEFGARFFSAFLGTLCIPAFYFLNRSIFRSRTQALIAAALLSFLTYEVAWCRQARFYAALQLLIILSTGLYFQFLVNRRQALLACSIVTAFLAAMTHPAGYLAGLVIGLSLLFQFRKVSSWIPWAASHKGIVLGTLVLSGLLALVLIQLPSNSQPLKILQSHVAPVSMDYTGRYIPFLRYHIGGFLFLAMLGMLITPFRHLATCLPISIGTLAYLYYLFHQNPLLHYRYLLPVIPFVLLLASGAFHLLMASLSGRQGKAYGTARVLLIVMLLLCLVSGRFSLRPQSSYDLGPTALQADWQQAWTWIADDWQINRDSIPLATYSTFPMFHDIYLGKQTGEPYFLPFSVSGLPGSNRRFPIYSAAVPIDSLENMLGWGGYAVADEFGLRMMSTPAIRQYLHGREPDQIIGKGTESRIYIWRIDPTRTAPSPGSE